MSLADNLPNQPKPYWRELLERVPLARRIWDADPRSLGRAALILSVLSLAITAASAKGLDPAAVKGVVWELLAEPPPTPSPTPEVTPTPAQPVMQPFGDWRDGEDVRAI